MAKNLLSCTATLFTLVVLLVPALLGQEVPSAEGAEATDSTMRNLLWMAPVAIVLVFLIRRKRQKRASAE